MQHLTGLLLLAVVRGELPAGLIMRIAMEHLVTFCPECRQELDDFQAKYADQQVFPPMPELVAALMNRQLEEQRSLISQATRDLTDLLKLPKEERSGRVSRAHHRFRGPHLVRLLLDASQQILTRSPEEGLHLAELAQTVFQQTMLHSSKERDLELQVMVLAQLANASRAAADFSASDLYFKRIRRFIVDQRLAQNPVLLARVDDLEGSLRRDQRNLDRAEELLARALFLYTLGEASMSERASVLVNLGIVYKLKGELDLAVEVTQTALRVAEGESRLCFAALYNLATYYVDLGNARAATKLLDENQNLIEAQKAEPLFQLRLTGLRGKIAGARGDLKTAEEALLQTRDGFLAHGTAFAYDAAIVSLDLALLYARAGRNDDLQAIVASILPTFRENALHREAYAAVLLLQETIQRGAAPLVLLRKLSTYMEQARKNPLLKFS